MKNVIKQLINNHTLMFFSDTCEIKMVETLLKWKLNKESVKQHTFRLGTLI